MIATIAGVDESEYGTSLHLRWDGESATTSESRHRETARSAIGRALPNLLPLLADPDHDVRRAVPFVLVACADRWETVIPALRDHIDEERDSLVRGRIDTVLRCIAKDRPEQAARFGLPPYSPPPPEPVTLSAQTARALGYLAEPDPIMRGIGCTEAGKVIDTWRAEHPELLDALVDAVGDVDLWETATDVLTRLGSAAAPVTDRILNQLEQYLRVTELPEGIDNSCPFQWLPLPWLSLNTRERSPHRVGPLLQLAANTGDRGAIPAVRWALELDEPPINLDKALAPLGAHALELLPLIRHRMVELHTRKADDDHQRASDRTTRPAGRCRCARDRRGPLGYAGAGGRDPRSAGSWRRIDRANGPAIPEPRRPVRSPGSSSVARLSPAGWCTTGHQQSLGVS
ncbi:hypothetical protein OHA40_31660 [Nocardia sp. NBC_00508]|uniref:hypothetical protein n=1 Tax=Nocardia sp. NBC_00508 TaxID=2975992 RepID=UPI002E806596|nr:hypothetical protein [Nocardia sp. NBC_00508]WUD66079.1 hypothetical protein OHA40_31660 [Nocardia sp. NBC_00508]